MSRTIILAILAAISTATSIAYFGYGQGAAFKQSPGSAETTGQKYEAEIVSAPGIVEAVSEEIEIGTELPGRLRSVNVEEGQQVAKGQTLAVIENDDYQTAVDTTRAQIQTLRSTQSTAQARLTEVKADRARIANGARPEERIEARAGYEQTLPEVENSRREYERRDRLFKDGIISREEMERSRTAYEVAQKRAASALERFNVINAVARQDDLAKADAAIRLAETQVREFDAQIAEAAARVREAEARLEKTIIRAPIAGIILRKRLKAGESVSPDSPIGIVTLADTSALRIRVDLDETDVAKIREGQDAFVTADAFGQRRFKAKVIRIGQILGRKNFRTDHPTEKIDTRILEVLLDLASDEKLPLGLRVDAFILVGNS